MIGKNGKNNKNLNSDESIVILLDSEFDVGKLKKHISHFKTTIISFDYASHKILTKYNISHEISDNYLTKEDLEEIHEKSFIFCKWYEISAIAKLLDFEGVNTGKLFFVEFHYFLVPFLKKFIEITKIYEKFQNQKFITTYSLYKILRDYTASVSIFGKKYREPDIFLYDSIKVRLTNSFSMSISRESYIHLKKILDMILAKIIKSSISKTESKTLVLAVELDPILYEKLLLSSSRYGLNFILHNRRRPFVWNLKSFNIVRKSNTIIVNYQKVIDANIKQTILHERNTLSKKIKLFSKYDDLFESYFSINEYSFWSTLKPIFINLCKKRILESVTEIITTKELFKKSKISSVLIRSENGFNEQIVIRLAKQFKIPITLLQHGLYNDAPEFFQLNSFLGIIPVDADNFISWGNIFKKYLVENGVSDKKIQTLGNTSFDNMFYKMEKIKNNRQDFVLLALPEIPKRDYVYDLTLKSNEKLEKIIINICNVVLKLNKKLVIKLHPFQEQQDVIQLMSNIDSSVRIIKKGAISEFIKYSWIVLTIDTTTTILEAQINRKPVITIKVKDDFENSYLLKTNSCISTSIENLEDVLIKILNDDYKQKIIENGNQFVNNYLSYQGNSSEMINSFLAKL